jgi:hypothetical protein
MDPKDLEKLLKVCQKYNVRALKLPQVELSIELDVIPTPQASESIVEAPSTSEEAILTEEQILLYSAT